MEQPRRGIRDHVSGWPSLALGALSRFHALGCRPGSRTLKPQFQSQHDCELRFSVFGQTLRAAGSVGGFLHILNLCSS